MIYVLTGIRVSKHVLAHRFLNIQRIFNPKKVLESWDLGLFNGTFRFSLSSSWYRIVVVHVVVQTGNAPSILVVTSNNFWLDRAFPVWTTTWTTTIRYQLLDRLNLKVPLNRPMSQLSKTFFGLKIRWILRNLWAKMCFETLIPVST